MDLVVVGLTVLLVAAAAVIVLVVLLRRRQAERERMRGAEMRALDERISERLGELVGKPRSRPDTSRADEPVPTGLIEPPTAPQQSLPPAAIGTNEPLPVSIGPNELQTTPEAPRPPAPLPVTEALKPRPMLTGRARPQAVAAAGRTRRRALARNTLIALAVIAVFVVVGSQVLGSRPSAVQGTPSPTNLATASSAPTQGGTPTPTGDIPTASPLPTATLGGPSPTPLASPHVYIVRRGDTMSSIAEAFGVTLADLIAANPQIEDPSLIYAGNVITIPTPVPTATAVP
jgi:LysM repeat protein